MIVYVEYINERRIGKYVLICIFYAKQKIHTRSRTEKAAELLSPKSRTSLKRKSNEIARFGLKGGVIWRTRLQKQMCKLLDIVIPGKLGAPKQRTWYRSYHG